MDPTVEDCAPSEVWMPLSPENSLLSVWSMIASKFKLMSEPFKLESSEPLEPEGPIARASMAAGTMVGAWRKGALLGGASLRGAVTLGAGKFGGLTAR
jgi:hypothetical protein